MIVTTFRLLLLTKQAIVRASDFQVVPLLSGFVPVIRFPVPPSFPFITPLS
jgi:hypothetical protein